MRPEDSVRCTPRAGALTVDQMTQAGGRPRGTTRGLEPAGALGPAPLVYFVAGGPLSRAVEAAHWQSGDRCARGSTLGGAAPIEPIRGPIEAADRVGCGQLVSGIGNERRKIIITHTRTPLTVANTSSAIRQARPQPASQRCLAHRQGQTNCQASMSGGSPRHASPTPRWACARSRVEEFAWLAQGRRHR